MRPFTHEEEAEARKLLSSMAEDAQKREMIRDAATDMLSALKKLLAQFEINLPTSGVVHDERQAMAEARLAISKAEGTAP